MSKETISVTDNRTGNKFEFPILKPTIGPDVVDISTFYKNTGMFTFDRGFTSTASCRSRITYIDGGAGKLMYRGYDIEYLATKKTFLDTVFLLLHKDLPTKTQLADFNLELKKRSFVHEGMKKLFDAFPDNAHPMAILSSAVAALSAFYSDSLDMDSPEEVIEMAHRIIAKIPTIAAFSYRYSKGHPVIYPDLNKSFTENFLYMLRAYPHDYVELRPIEIEALDTIFTLHADHEQNASTTAVRVVASTQAHPYAAISSGVGALWGRAHGGANESVIRQLEMMGSVDNVDKYIAKAKDKNDPFRLMGFGHRVYKNFDPRATILKNLRNKLIDELEIDSNQIIPDFFNSVIMQKLRENELFIEQYEKHRKNQQHAFHRYIESFDTNIEKEGIALVDVGWGGTMQECIYHFLNKEVPVTGYYIGLKEIYDIEPNTKRFGLNFSIYPSHGISDDILKANGQLYEQLLGAPHGSTLGYSIVNGSPQTIEFHEENEKYVFDKLVKNVQEYMVIEFEILFLALRSINYSHTMVQEYLTNMALRNGILTSKKKIIFINDLSKGFYQNVGENKVGLAYSPNQLRSSKTALFKKFLRSPEKVFRLIVKVKPYLYAKGLYWLSWHVNMAYYYMKFNFWVKKKWFPKSLLKS